MKIYAHPALISLLVTPFLALAVSCSGEGVIDSETSPEAGESSGASSGEKGAAVSERSVVLASVGSRNFTIQDLDPRARARLSALEFEIYALLRGEAQAFVEEAVVEEAARAQGAAPTVLLASVSESRVQALTDAELSSLLEEPATKAALEREYARIHLSSEAKELIAAGDRAAIAARDAERARIRAGFENRLRDRTERRRLEAERLATLEAWTIEQGGRITVPIPHLPTVDLERDGFVTIAEGASDGAGGVIQLVLDPADGRSGRLLQALTTELEQLEGVAPTIQVAYVPSKASPEAQRHAEALQCAALRDGGAVYHAGVFADPVRPARIGELVSVAKAAGLDHNLFGACFAKGEARESVLALQGRIRAHGLESPAVLVDGVEVPISKVEVVSALLEAKSTSVDGASPVSERGPVGQAS